MRTFREGLGQYESEQALSLQRFSEERQESTDVLVNTLSDSVRDDFTNALATASQVEAAVRQTDTAQLVKNADGQSASLGAMAQVCYDQIAKIEGMRKMMVELDAADDLDDMINFFRQCAVRLGSAAKTLHENAKIARETVRTELSSRKSKVDNVGTIIAQINARSDSEIPPEVKAFVSGKQDTMLKLLRLSRNEDYDNLLQQILVECSAEVDAITLDTLKNHIPQLAGESNDVYEDRLQGERESFKTLAVQQLTAILNAARSRTHLIGGPQAVAGLLGETVIESSSLSQGPQEEEEANKDATDKLNKDIYDLFNATIVKNSSHITIVLQHRETGAIEMVAMKGNWENAAGSRLEAKNRVIQLINSGKYDIDEVIEHQSDNIAELLKQFDPTLELSCSLEDPVHRVVVPDCVLSGTIRGDLVLSILGQQDQLIPAGNVQAIAAKIEDNPAPKLDVNTWGDTLSVLADITGPNVDSRPRKLVSLLELLSSTDEVVIRKSSGDTVTIRGEEGTGIIVTEPDPQGGDDIENRCDLAVSNVDPILEHFRQADEVVVQEVASEEQQRIQEAQDSINELGSLRGTAPYTENSRRNVLGARILNANTGDILRFGNKALIVNSTDEVQVYRRRWMNGKKFDVSTEDGLDALITHIGDIETDAYILEQDTIYWLRNALRRVHNNGTQVEIVGRTFERSGDTFVEQNASDPVTIDLNSNRMSDSDRILADQILAQTQVRPFEIEVLP